jgi:hypothetical protein
LQRRLSDEASGFREKLCQAGRPLHAGHQIDQCFFMCR